MADREYTGLVWCTQVRQRPSDVSVSHTNDSRVRIDCTLGNLAAYPGYAACNPVSEYVYSMLYRATPPTWLSVSCIQALCDRLVADFPWCRFTGFQSVVITSSQTRDASNQVVAASVLERVFAQVTEPGVEVVLMPLNFHNAHWCSIVIKVSDKKVVYYDPLNQKPFLRAAKEIAEFVMHRGLQDYSVTPQIFPIQFDQFSCGVYVCWTFLRHVVHGVTLDMSSSSLSQRRFELFTYILTGSLISPIHHSQHHSSRQSAAEHAQAKTDSNLDEEKELPPD